MATQRTRRNFLADVGRGALVATLGSGTAADLGLGPASLQAGEDSGRLTFGDCEPLVALMQETPVNRLMPVLVERLRGGTPLRDLLAASHFWRQGELSTLELLRTCVDPRGKDYGDLALDDPGTIWGTGVDTIAKYLSHVRGSA